MPLPEMTLTDDNFEVFGSIGSLDVLNNDIVAEIIDSLEIVSILIK